MSINDAKHCHRRGGPPPFLVQLLRAPLTLNNIIALAITHSVHRDRQAAGAGSDSTTGGGCGNYIRTDAVFGLLALFFAASLGHNMLTVLRFHRIQRQVFGGESICARKRRWRQRGEVALDEEERNAWALKFKEMGRRMPSLLISVGDVILALSFLGLYILTTMLAKKEGKVELGVAYASIGALVAFILNFMIGINGVKLWARQRQERDESEGGEAGLNDMKERLLEH